MQQPITLKPNKLAMVIGASAGGIQVLNTILPFLPSDCQIPVVVVLHIGKNAPVYFVRHLQETCKVRVKEAEMDEKPLPGVVYFAPPNYHLLMEQDQTFALSVDEEVNYSRPSIDVLFESASLAFHEHLIGVILTGANNDGALGMEHIHKAGGLTLVQEPNQSFAGEMPSAVLKRIIPDHLLSPDQLCEFMRSINQYTKPYHPIHTNHFPCQGLL